MGAQWKHAGRIQNSSKRSALVGKLVKEIIVSAKMGDPSPENNARLRAGVEAAKKQSVPRDTIERAIKKGAGLLDDPVQFETISYEGFAPHRVPVIVECLTDNKNRTAADVRVLFRKGQLGSQGAVAWMFDRLGVVEATMGQAGVDIEGAAIEAGAQNVEPLEAEEVLAGQTGARFFADPTDLDSVAKALVQAGWTVTLSELSYVPKSIVELGEAEKKEAIEFLQALDDHDDVHRVYTALK
ncbi:MAG: YebC/PmpR family DNA-binding transcriptional regulator [Bdellovibrionales bacterium]|nr:YebC/PmpR family DNA-binding transcriptional regulator [Bdellovibrionales bacterium]